MSSQNATKEESRAAIAVVSAVAEAIRSLGSVPSGHLYARLMGQMTLNTYNAIIGVLVNAKLVKIEHHELFWIGPKDDGSGS